MCSELKLLTEVALQSKTYTNHGIISSEDFQYCIIVEDGFYILQLCGFMDNFIKTMSFTKQFIKVNKYAISSNLGVNINSFITSLPKNELYEAVLRVDLSEELNDASVVKQQAILAKWSPLGLVDNNNCVLGVLSHTGSVSLFVDTLNEVEYENFIEVTNVSEICVDYVKSKMFGDDFDSLPSNNFAELKRRVDIATSNTFAWSHLISENDKKFCLIIVGQLDGGLIVCRVNSMNLNEVGCECEVIRYYQTGMKRLTAMHWQKANNNNGLLIVGDLEGRTKAISITNIVWDSVEFESETWLWDQLDNIRIEHFKVIVYENNIYVFIVKGTDLLICLINQVGKILDIHPHQIGNLQITGIEHYEKNIILVLTYTGVLKEVRFSCKNDKIHLDHRNIYIDFKWWAYRTHGLIISRNKVFIGVLVSLSKLTNIKKRKDHVRFLIFMNTAKNPLQTLLHNNSNLLTMYWDCLEVLRLNALLQKTLTTDELPQELDYDKLSLVQLKTCFWLAKSSEMMHDKTQLYRKVSVIKFDEVKYILKIKLAIQHAHYLLQCLASGDNLSEFHMQSLDIINMFLKETILDGIIHKLGLGKVTIDELYDVIIVANELQYPPPPKCLWCEEHILFVIVLCVHYLIDFS
ncbi:hypothetical protein RN001_010231 [Aquatica leii]|uniref:Transcription factor IIIC 90kDa subunit N-terminal domain-containing protein n=1 Tax=Aquatica leii TaxID=1421715 RepID=A0AAN7SQ84_9COLE|nr:hypothetical protein RN001_010231 [Aquatica leii]